tara:strand:- start:108 stop:506 length:399 start_codon:yes stop_codon:yes gene_type:complete
MSKLDKIVLAILAIEHLGFGIYGLYSPNSIAGLVGYELGSEFAYSEMRANYGMFTALGCMALLSIFIHSMARQTYIIYSIIFSSLILGRILNYFITGDLVTSIIVAIVAEAIVVGLCIWRLAANRQTAETIN